MLNSAGWTLAVLAPAIHSACIRSLRPDIIRGFMRGWAQNTMHGQQNEILQLRAMQVSALHAAGHQPRAIA